MITTAMVLVASLRAKTFMRTARLRSIAAKLFYMTTTLVVLTVAGNSLQNAVVFDRHVEREVQEHTVSVAKERAAAVSSLFDHWRSELAMLVHSLGLRSSDVDKEAELNAFLEANHDAAFLEIVRQTEQGAFQTQAVGVTKNVLAANFEGRTADDVTTVLKEGLSSALAARVAGQKTPTMFLENLAVQTHLPLIALMAPYTVKGAPDRYWAILVMWSSRLVAALPAPSPLLRSRILDASGHVLASPVPEEAMSGVAGSGKILATEALASASPFGLKGFKDGLGVEWLGAYAKLDAFDATLLIEKNTKDQALAANAIVRRSALWGWTFVLLAVFVSFFGAAGITANLRSLTKATMEIAEGHLDTPVLTRGADEVAQLGESVQNMATKIGLLLKEQVAKAQFEKELETAQIVQNCLFPKDLPSNSRLRIASFYQPASQCGGDWWGRFSCADGSEFICIGDATGHGAGAALVTALVYACCMTAAAFHREQGEQQNTPAALLQRINQLLLGSVHGTIAMTFFAARLDPQLGQLSFANAGHNFPLLYPLDRDDERYQGRLRKPASTSGQEAITLTAAGNPLGMDSASEYVDHTIAIRPGDKIVFYTDGLIECENSAHEPWGKRRMLASLRSALGGGAEQLVNDLKSQALTFYGGQALADDITLVVVEIPLPAEGTAVAS